MKKNRPKPSVDSFRYRSPEDEGRHQWLSLLLDAYEVIDRGIFLALQREKRKTGRRPVCKAGCGGCCGTHSDIPLYPMEMTGLYWYVLEKMEAPLRTALMQKIEARSAPIPAPDSSPVSGLAPCPFLSDSQCTVYPVRPIACRQFMVFNRPCGDGEDPFHTRRGDVLTPLEEFAEQAFYIMLPFYGINSEEDRKAAIKNRIIHARVRNLKTTDWQPLAQRIAESLHHNKEV
ncbi:MAG: YkgJ family cysteine cluster protein [Thermodesulfovibrio sp.]|nr:YkgJ family cysteine cluster protein [Thermodesulfovibrio sp.]